MTRQACWPLLILLTGAAGLTAQVEPVGDEIEIAAGGRFRFDCPRVAILLDGSFLAIWKHLGTLHGSVHGPDGGTPRPDFVVADVASSSFCDVAADGEGFLVVCSEGFTGGSTEVWGRSFQPDGTADGTVFSIRSGAGDTGSAVAGLPGGGFLALWSHHEGGSRGRSQVLGRRIRDGTPSGVEFQIDEGLYRFLGRQSVSFGPAGGVAIWRSQQPDDPDDPIQAVRARRLRADGTPEGASFQVNSIPTHETDLPRVAAWEGGFVASWLHYVRFGPSGPFAPILRTRRFDETGAPTDPEDLTLDEDPPSFSNDFSVPDVGLAASGDALVVYSAFRPESGDESGMSIQGLPIARGGVPGPGFLVNTRTEENQMCPAIAAAGSEAVVAWQSDGVGAFGVRARRVRITAPPVAPIPALGRRELLALAAALAVLGVLLLRRL